MDDGHNALAENQTMSEAEDMADTGYALTIAWIRPTVKVPQNKLNQKAVVKREMTTLITLCLLLIAPWLRSTWTTWVRINFLTHQASANNLQSQTICPKILRMLMYLAEKCYLTISHLFRWENFEVARPWSWLISTKLNHISLCFERSPHLLMKGCVKVSKLLFALILRLSLWTIHRVILVWSYFNS